MFSKLPPGLHGLSRRTLATSTALLIAGAVMFVPVTQSSADETKAVTTEAVFNDPTGAEAEQQAIVTKLVDLIEGAADGSQVRMSMFYADDPAVPNALIAAHERGVKVQAVFDRAQLDNAEVYDSLVTELGENTAADSFVTTCPSGRGCVGTRKLSSVTAINHNKFFLFSDTLDTPNVVVQASANLHLGRDGTKGWNNALVLPGKDDIYDAYNGYFGDQLAAKGNNNYYDTRKPVTQDNSKIHFFPRQEASGADPYNDPSEDTIETLLEHIKCTGNTDVGTPDDHRTIVRVNQMIFSQPYLAEKLVDLDAAGCDVQVVVTQDMGNKLAAKALNAVLAKTDNEYGGVGVGYFCQDDSVWSHNKYVVVEGSYYGVSDRRLVWTGSANWSTNSLRQSDETTLQLEDDDIADDYLANFDKVLASTTHRPGNGDSIACG